MFCGFVEDTSSVTAPSSPCHLPLKGKAKGKRPTNGNTVCRTSFAFAQGRFLVPRGGVAAVFAVVFRLGREKSFLVGTVGHFTEDKRRGRLLFEIGLCGVVLRELLRVFCISFHIRLLFCVGWLYYVLQRSAVIGFTVCKKYINEQKIINFQINGIDKYAVYVI